MKNQWNCIGSIRQVSRMDRKEAIELIKRHMIIHQIGKYPHIKLGEALSLAIEALQEPQVSGVEINKNFETILLCAVRYAIGRRTYIPSMVIDYITPLLPYLSEDVLRLIADEIIGRYTYEGALGDEMIDKPYWEQFLRKIRLEIGGRYEP